MNFFFTIKVIGHVLIWTGSVTIAILPWLQRRNIVQKYTFESDYSMSALTDKRCHLLGWSRWSRCPETSSANSTKAQKSRFLVGDCLQKDYKDYAPCFCPLEECHATEVVENFVKKPCSPNDNQTFELQLIPHSEDTLFYSTKRMVLGRVAKC
ncbi:hypothetical protein Y032_0400g750 [Ancylostoma ceylanicum]|uniref:Uncharacterized protein n=1 Tax=Ancylostoma ceylanicum TaxID=53326 RepID=A0A016RRL9_9BILA|nr:hypothetical protein Y032_0400g750 [Ancylostoma ceylanicum]